MKYSVVGLPHYTIWHLYEPSVDDIRHMEEMEQERKQREQEEAEKKERLEKINSQFEEGSSQWEKDKEGIRDMSNNDAKKTAKKASEKASQKAAEVKMSNEKLNEDAVAEEV